MKLETLAQGSHSGLRGRRRQELVIRTQPEWDDFYRTLVSEISPQPTMPVIDFNQYSVLAVFRGEKYGNGYSTDITTVIKTGDNIEVYVRESSPVGKLTSLDLSQPYHVVKVEKVKGKVKFSYYS